MAPDLFHKCQKNCVNPLKSLRLSDFPFDGLITPTLKAAGSSPVGRTKKERHLLKADVFLFWVPPPARRLHPPVMEMLGRSEFAISALRAALRAVALRNAAAAAVRRDFAYGKTLVRRKCAAGQKAGLPVLLLLPQPLKISIFSACLKRRGV